MIAIIDYKAGNLTSVVKALHALSAEVEVTSDPDVVRCAEKLVLPGVGHFAATQRLEHTGVTAAIRESILGGVPFLGICVGLQWLFSGSEEAPDTPGLGIFEGQCERFPDSVKVPHVGWNSLHADPCSRILHGLDADSYVYYTHSYRAPYMSGTVGTTDYAGVFSGAVEKGNIFGVQFHPEKSGDAGLRVLRNFLELPVAC